MAQSESLLPLLGGAYEARSKIANYQICENLFLEINPQDTDPPAPVTHYPREGKRLLSGPQIPGRGRGVFSLSNGNLFAIVADRVYFIDRNWAWQALGRIADLATPVSMSDNGTNGVLVDGTPNGYTINLATNAFAQIVDGTGTFLGSRRVDFSDTFLGFAAPGTNEWYVSLSNQVAFNALVTANKDTTPDPIQTFAFNIRQAWLLGTKGSEIWYLAGGIPFPYQAWPNVFVPYGCVAPYSLVQADVDLFWISNNQQGEAIALKTNQYGVIAISTRGLEYEWSTYPTVADVIGSTFQQGGHTFIIFNFPTADKTWAYDLATKQWHRRTSIDHNGVQRREKTTYYATVGETGGYPRTIVGQDWSNGQIYALDPTVFVDNDMPIVCRRSFPHIVANLDEVTRLAVVADFETGGIPGTTDVPQLLRPWSSGFSSGFGPNSILNAPALCMRYSNNGGATFSNYRQKGLVSAGHYRSMMRWRGLGMGRDIVFEFMWAYPGPSALQGAYVAMLEHGA